MLPKQMGILGRLTGAVVVAAAIGAAGELGVILDVRGGLDRGVQESLQREFERILRVPGLAIQWRILNEETSRESFDRLIVVRMVGSCSPAVPLAFNVEDSVALGRTHVSNGRILPFTEIECDHVRELLERRVWKKDIHVRRALVGRALARVLAHEVYHILGQTAEHSSSGVARDCFTSRELACDKFDLEPDCLQRVAVAMDQRRAKEQRARR